MSRKKLWQICHKNIPNNQHVTLFVVGVLQRRHLPVKQVAWDINIATERVRNWYYKNTGMTAHDLLLLILHYGFIRKALFEKLCLLDMESRLWRLVARSIAFACR